MPTPTALTRTLLKRTTTNGHDLTAALTAVDGTNGNTFSNTGRTLLRVKNGAGSGVTVTIPYTETIDGAVPSPKTYTVPATTGDRLLGPFPPELFGGNPVVTYSSGTSVTAGVLELAED